LDTLSEESYKEGILKKREQNNGNPVLFSISKDSCKEGILKKEQINGNPVLFSISKESHKEGILKKRAK
jgi:hypothetical protein